MNFAIDDQCLLCYLRRNIELVRPLGSTEKTMDFARALMRIYLDGPRDVASPYFAPQVADLLHEMYGLDIDRYRQEKLDSNAFVLERMDQLREKVFSAPDRILAGLQFAILGNYLDFAALRDSVSFEKLDEMLENALEMTFDMNNFRSLCEDMEKGRKLLYLTDNAGEIGFDRIFAEAMARQYPNLEITFCVRGGIAQNDATREDAAQVGIPFKVIDNGNRVPGTQLDQLSREARTALEEADLVLAKGMANVETMYGCGKNVYYAFLIKCPRFQQRFDKPMFTPMLVREGQY